jgi:hypothetical protein
MRTLSLSALAWLWPIALTAQERVAVNLNVAIPDFLRLTVEREGIVDETETSVTRQVHLRVEANRAWTLLVSCETGAAVSEPASADGSWTSAEADVLHWRNRVSDSGARECSGGPAPAAQGFRGDDGRVVLELTAPSGSSGALRYALIPR